MCKRYEKKRYHVEDNRRQRVISRRQLEGLRWYGCSKEEERKVACSREGKAQQGGTWAGAPEGVAKEGGKQREVRQTFKILREVWLSIGIEKTDTHEEVTVKALLDSSTTGMFMDKRTAAKHGFRL